MDKMNQQKWCVPYVDLPARYTAMQPELGKAIEDVFKSGRFIGGEIVERFEQEMAAYLGVKYVVGVGSGYDALYLALRVLGIGPGDKVITVSHTFVATIAAIKAVGATPILIDVDQDGLMNANLLEAAITPKTRAILPVHMNGAMCDMPHIMNVAYKYGLEVIEDAAQAIGSSLHGKKAGAWGNAGCFSLHPLKTLSVAGDGGFVATNNAEQARRLCAYRNHGQQDGQIIGYGINSRLDALQAGIALLQLKKLDKQIMRRQELAIRYNTSFLRTVKTKDYFEPFDSDNSKSYSSYVLQSSNRDALHVHLTEMGIETFVHWPIPLHKNGVLNLHLCRPLPITEALSEQVISLPIYPEMTDDQQNYVIRSVKGFYER